MIRTPLLLLLAAVPVTCLAQQRLALDAERHDFGRIRAGAKVAHRFRITNAGDAPLRILRVNASCGCTSTVVGRDTLGPGEGTELEVVLDASGYRGPLKKFIELVTDDPAGASRTLAVEADVLAEVIPATQEIAFRDLARKDRRKRSVKLTSGTGEPIAVLDAELSEAPWLGVATRPVGKDVYVDLDLLARNLPPGKESGTDTIALRVANPNPSVVNLRVTWEKLAPVIAEPPRVALAEPAGRDVPCDVTLRSRDGRPFRILSARSTHPLIRVPDLPGAAPRQKLRFVVGGALPAGNWEEQVILALEGGRELTIRFSMVLR